MTAHGYIQIALFFAVVVATAVPHWQLHGARVRQ